MERERWLKVYQLLLRLDDGNSRGVFTAAAVLAVFFWAVIYDRPVSWACRRGSWPADLRPNRLPSQSTMSRRLRDPQVLALQQRVEDLFKQPRFDSRCRTTCIDGKPLPIGGCSKDRQANWGRGARSWCRGYKLYAIWGAECFPRAWRVAAMGQSEQSMAEIMIPELRGHGWLLGDKLYDINKLYDAAARVGYQLLAPRKRPQARLARYRHSPSRLRGLALLETDWGQRVYARRTHIERCFAGLTSNGGGLTVLPPWVRTLPRVRLWVHAKLILNALRLAPNRASS